MSLNKEAISCVRCKSYLFEEDDVVYCPVCGAPHHRECYNALGHCALEELHGTDNEYSRQKAEIIEEPKEEQTENTGNLTVCEMCGGEFDPQKDVCPHCHSPNMQKMAGFSQFDFLGGVPAEYDLGEGVTANEAKQFVASNTHRYIPKFAVLNKRNKVSWNWMAFLFPTGWMLSRKMYKPGIITAVLSIAASCLSVPFVSAFNLESSVFTVDNISSIAEQIPEIGAAALGLCVLGVIFEWGIRIVSAIFGDYIYKNHTISTILRIRSEGLDKVTEYRKRGGMSLLMFIIGIMIIQYGSLLITMLIK